MATLDPPLDVMRSQVLACTELELAEIGWIAGATHRQEGAHFPEDPAPPGNPVDEVDAIDVPHAPDRGADMHVMTESLRVAHAEGRDNRLRLVIFNGRQWTNYWKDGIPPYTWRPYTGENLHRGHAHIERTDVNRGDLRPFEIGIDGMLNLDQQVPIGVDANGNTVTAKLGHWMRTIAIRTDYIGNVFSVEVRNLLKQTLAAALDDGDTTVNLPPESIEAFRALDAKLDELAATVADLPGAVVAAEAAALAD